MTDIQNTDFDAMIPAWVEDSLTPVGKLETHQRGLRHKAVSVFIMAGTKTLIQRRALGKYHTPGLWANSCCTHPHWDEPAIDCALRRLDQELGITGLRPDFREQLEYRADVGNGLIEHELVDLFVCQATTDLHIAPNPDEVMDFEWLELAELKQRIAAQPDRFTPWLKIYLAKHSDRIFNHHLA